MKTLNQTWSALSSFVQEKQLGFATWTLLLLSGMLLFVYSLPHAMALRKLFVFIAFLFAFKYFWGALQKKPKPFLAAVLVISDQPLASFSEWKGQWLPALMSFIAGIGLARALMLSKLKDARVAVALVITVPLVIFLCVNAVAIGYALTQPGNYLPGHYAVGEYGIGMGLYGIGGQKGIIGYQITLLVPILIADLFSRLVKGNRLLPVPVWVILAIFVLAIFTLFAASSRNGMLILMLAFAIGAVMMISEIRKRFSAKKIITFVLATLIIVFSIALVAYKADPRWQSFVETIPLAWDIDRDQLWIHNDGVNLPLTPSGKQADPSEYYRIAWSHEGWRMLMEHPWGLEIARDTFHKLVLAKYGHADMSHSHNAWMDFGLEVGIPGLLLWGGFLWLQAKFGWQAWSKNKEPLGVALAIMVIMFAAHGILDSIFRDHMIEQFMLVAGLLLSALTFRKNDVPQT
jgi:hypothetical protein